MAGLIKAWSFSRYSTYKMCPQKAKFSFIDRIQEPPNDAMARGAKIHDDAEAYIKGKIDKMPEACKAFSKLFRRLRRQYKKATVKMVVEDTWAFTRTWDETTWNDWANCWLRVKLDCAETKEGRTLVVSDWKTGKYRPQSNAQYTEQLELYALGALLIMDDVDVVKPRLVYLDAEVIFPAPGTQEEQDLTFTRDDLEDLKKSWEARTKAMLNDRVFAPTPNNLCGWCHYRRDNAANGGGQCEY